MSSVSRSVTGSGVAGVSAGVGRLAVRGHDAAPRGDAGRGQASRAARRGPAGTRAASSTQNDWKLRRAPGGVGARRAGPATLGELVAGSGAASSRRRRDHRVEPAELDQPDRGLDVGHPVVEADLEVALRRRGTARVPLGGARRSCRARAAGGRGRPTPRRAVVSMPPSPVVSELARVEGPGGELGARARPGGRGTVEPAPQAASSTTAMPQRVAQRADRVDVDRHAALVDDDDGPGARRQRRRRRCRRVRLPVSASTSANTGVAPTYVGRVGGGDEREATARRPRRRARPRPRRGPGAAPSCSCDTATRVRGLHARGEAPLELAPPAGPGPPSRSATTSATAAASSSPSQGCITLIAAHDGRRRAHARRRSASRCGAPPVDQLAQPVLEADLGLEAEVALGRGDVGQPPGDAVHRALRAVLDRAGRSPSPAAAPRPARAGWSPRRWRCCRRPSVTSLAAARMLARAMSVV